MADQVVYRQRTAIRRNQLSRPVSLAIRDAVLKQEDVFFDYGCGRGEDIEFLRSMGFQADGWDPSFRPDSPCTDADIVNLGYVINVVENTQERDDTLRRAYSLARGALVVSAMVGYTSTGVSNTTPFSDGLLTSRGTFQRYFQQSELGEYVSSTLGVHAYAAGIGTFYIFKDEAREAAYCTMLVQEPRGGPEDTRVRGMAYLSPDTLGRIAGRVRITGCLPTPEEWPDDAIALGVLASSDDWIGSLASSLEATELEAIRQAKREELLVAFASSYFSNAGRLRLADLSRSARADIRSVFGSINRAYRETEELFAQLIDSELILALSRKWGYGKLTPSALYLHHSLVTELPFELKLLVSCARAMAVDDLVEGANLIKLSHAPLAVSFAWYENFDEEAHPWLTRIVRSDFESGSVTLRDYSESSSPPILHRKELLVSAAYPKIAEFRHLSEVEASLGLLGRRDIGSLQPWLRLLAANGVTVRGHTIEASPCEQLWHEPTPTIPDQVNDACPIVETDDFDDLCDQVTVRRVRSLPGAKPRRLGPPTRRSWPDNVLLNLANAIYQLGRRPLEDEIPLPPATVRRFLSLKNWQQLLGHRFDFSRYEQARKTRWSDWIVLLGSARFAAAGRPQFRRLTTYEQADVKHLFGSYRQACIEADQWLFRIGNPEEVEREILSWPRGRHHETKGLYVHSSLEPQLPLLVRLLLSCGRHLAKDALPPRTDVLRIDYNGSNVKFYQYNAFDAPAPSPRVQGTKVDFRRRRVIVRHYDDPLRAPLLDSKAELIDTSYPFYIQLSKEHEEATSGSSPSASLQDINT